MRHRKGGGGAYSGEKTYGCWAGLDEKSRLGEPLLARKYVRHVCTGSCLSGVLKYEVVFKAPPGTLRKRTTGSRYCVLNKR